MQILIKKIQEEAKLPGDTSIPKIKETLLNHNQQNEIIIFPGIQEGDSSDASLTQSHTSSDLERARACIISDDIEDTSTDVSDQVNSVLEYKYDCFKHSQGVMDRQIVFAKKMFRRCSFCTQLINYFWKSRFR